MWLLKSWTVRFYWSLSDGDQDIQSGSLLVWYILRGSITPIPHGRALVAIRAGIDDDSHWLTVVAYIWTK